MENMRVPELKALAREHRLRVYSRLRKAELIAFLQDNEHQAPRRPHSNRPPLPPPQRHTAGPQGPCGTLSARSTEAHSEAPGALRDPQRPLHRCLLGNQIYLHRCLLGNRRGNCKPKSDNLS